MTDGRRPRDIGGHSRRRLLSIVGSGLIAGGAGCSGEEADNTADPETTNPSGDTETEDKSTVLGPEIAGGNTVGNIFVDTQNSNHQSGATVTTTKPAPRLQQDVDVEYNNRINSGPLITDRHIVIQSDGDMFGISRQDGALVWTLSEAAAEPYNSLGQGFAVVEDVVVTLADNRRTGDTVLIGVDPTGGTAVWEIPLSLNDEEQEYISSLHISDKTAYLGTTFYEDGNTSRLITVDLQAQSVGWKTQITDGDFHPEDMALEDRILIITTDEAPDGSANVLAFDVEAREHLWDATLPIGEARPVIDGANVYLPSDEAIVAYDRATGDISWEFSLQSTPRTGVSVDEAMVYIIGQERLYAVSAAEGEAQWTYEVDDQTLSGNSGSLPVVTDNLLLTGSWVPESGIIQGINKQNGELAWKYRVNLGAVTAPFVAGNFLWALSYEFNQTRIHSLGVAQQ